MLTIDLPKAPATVHCKGLHIFNKDIKTCWEVINTEFRVDVIIFRKGGKRKGERVEETDTFNCIRNVLCL